MKLGLLVAAVYCLACAPRAAPPIATDDSTNEAETGRKTPTQELPIQIAMRDWAANWATALEPMREPIAKMEAGSTDRVDCNALIVGVRNAQLVAKLAPDEDVQRAAYNMLSTFNETGMACLRKEGDDRDIGLITGRAGSTLINGVLKERYQLSAAAWLDSPEKSAATDRALALLAKKKAEADRASAEAARIEAAREAEREARMREIQQLMRLKSERSQVAFETFDFCNHAPGGGAAMVRCNIEARACDDKFATDHRAAIECFRSVVASHQK